MAKLSEKEKVFVCKKKKLNPFTDIIKSINAKSGNIFDEEPYLENQYVPYIVNKALAGIPDTFYYAELMNKCADLPNKMQYDFYYYGLPKSSKRGNWVKAEVVPNLDVVKNYYNCSTKKAKQYLKFLKATDLDMMKKYIPAEGQ